MLEDNLSDVHESDFIRLSNSEKNLELSNVVEKLLLSTCRSVEKVGWSKLTKKAKKREKVSFLQTLITQRSSNAHMASKAFRKLEILS